MIDPRMLRDDPDRVRAAQRRRGESEAIVDELRAADAARRAAIVDFERLRAEQKQLGTRIPRTQGDERAALLARTKQLGGRVKVAESAQAEAEATFTDLMATLPNVADERAPAGGEEDYLVLETHGTIRDLDTEGFPPRDHLELGAMLRAIDVERGVKVSGSRFYFLTGVGAMLELALVQMAMERAEAWGFTPVVPPALVKPRAMDGTGFLGQASADVYHLPDDDLYLVGTSEVPLAAYHCDEILDAATLPRRYVAFSPCFRREAGSYGRDTRGIIRVHWFDKVEMFAHTTLEESYAEHERLLGFERRWLTELELPFRVIDVAAGDLGMSAIRKFDCEAWLPSQRRYLELTSTSNCTQFQARRLNIRVRTEPGGGARTEPAATLNGTLCAVPRTIVALLENHQQADGSVRVPLALRPYLQGRDVLKPAGSGE